MLLIEVVIDNCVDQPMGDGGKDETTPMKLYPRLRESYRVMRETN